MEKCDAPYCAFRSTRAGAVTSHTIAARAQRRDGGPVFPCRSCRYIMCVSCGHKCTQFPDKPSVPADQDLEEVARSLYPAGTISFRLPTTTASTLPTAAGDAIPGAGVARMGTAMEGTASGSVDSSNIVPPNAATYSTVLRTTPQYITAPNTTTAYAPTRSAPAPYSTAPHGATSRSTAPNTTAAYTPTQNALAPYSTAPYAATSLSTAPNTTAAYTPTHNAPAPYSTAPYATTSYSTAPYDTATYTTAPRTLAPYATTSFSSTPFSIGPPPTATSVSPRPIPEPQLQPTSLLVPSNSLAVPFAIMPRPPGILENRTRTEGQATPDLHASYMGQDNEEFRYPPPSREGHYMALARRRRG
ncbi:hypothetical protein KC332_g3485 [Hortaea werneckii]|nr:hypothetical protein KC350_g11552 [Hortaea werneckii]KAI6839022.1 hypothetical protein KC358_g4744 [Hortaea werneckii]KAI6940667.1 hypothetical protein KC341_g3360 [Hortaea werneckii]KAI6945184.1 hypothetical protein KC348_g3790 [Hortaea werneckii]KAI6978032.1 hypothetical protein KC321_g3130 [Hortaea werneckii]